MKTGTILMAIAFFIQAPQVLLILSVLILVSANSEPQREVVLFDKADVNHDGQLTLAELNKVFFLFDANNDHQVTKTEFDTDWVTTFAIGNHKESAALFSKADVNDDGVIDNHDLPGIFSFFDSDGDRHVSINEFLTHWGALKLTAVVHVINLGNDNTTTETPDTTTYAHNTTT